MSYKIVESLSSKELENQVKLLIELGWKPIGGVSIGVIIIKDRLEYKYVQTLTHENKSVVNDKTDNEKRKKDLKNLYKKSL
jgi:hypothetical protein